MQRQVEIPSDGITLSGVLHVPDDLAAGERRPAIVMLHGFGANKRGGPETICTEFEQWGYIAMRFDFRGCGESGGKRGRVLPLEHVNDVRNAVTAMTQWDEVDPNRIAVCGSSLGAGVGIYATAIDQRIAAVITENCLARGETVIRGMHDEDSFNGFLHLMHNIQRDLLDRGQVRTIHRFSLYEMPKHLQANLASNGSLMEFSGETALGYFSFRPVEMVSKIAPRPMLLLHARGDRLTPYTEAFELVKRAGSPCELHLIDGANHFMFVHPDPRVLSIMKGWLDLHFPIRAGDPAAP